MISLQPTVSLPIQRRLLCGNSIHFSYVLWIAITLRLTILTVYFVSPLCSRNIGTVISALCASTVVCSVHLQDYR